MNSAPSDPLIGRTLDSRYVVRSRIARGGMAMVYLGNDLRLQRRVAIKIMHGHLVEDENFTRRFEQEARSAAMLGHANVVGVFDQGIDGGLPYLVMEYLPGITLRELLKQNSRLTIDQALEIGEAILAGLTAAHAAGIVHRDLKPENVLLADDGRIKIGDFGLARAVSAHTTTGQALLGTIAYLSPELVTRGDAGVASDIYAFGIMVFEMLTGRQPFEGEQAMQIAYQHAHSDVPLPSTLDRSITPEIDELVRWCTQRDPSLRPADASEALALVRRIRSGALLGETTVLPMTGVVTSATASTTVIGEVHGEASTPPDGDTVDTQKTNRAARLTPVEAASASGAKRAKRGKWIAALVTLLIAFAGGAGWWFGQGPGSLITVPEVAGQELAVAQSLLEEHTLAVELVQCPSLDVAAGLAAETRPAAGTRVERGAGVQLCESTGPQQLPVPSLVGLTVDEAAEAIAEAGFVFGEVAEERFDGGARGTVVAGLDAEGEQLAETYSEQGVIDLIVSAGSLPAVTGSTVGDATAVLAELGLTVDEALNTQAHHNDVPEGHVIAVVNPHEILRVGDTVGLEISQGPELFPIPDVAGMDLQDAMDALSAAGFEPSTAVPNGLRRFAEATGTSPAAGELVRHGTTVQVRANISL